MNSSLPRRRSIANQSKSLTIPRKFPTISYSTVFWKQIDPTQADGQFTDIGPSYRAAIFYGNEEEKKTAEASKNKLAQSENLKANRNGNFTSDEVLCGGRLSPEIPTGKTLAVSKRSNTVQDA